MENSMQLIDTVKPARLKHDRRRRNDQVARKARKSSKQTVKSVAKQVLVRAQSWANTVNLLVKTSFSDAKIQKSALFAFAKKHGLYMITRSLGQKMFEVIVFQNKGHALASVG